MAGRGAALHAVTVCRTAVLAKLMTVMTVAYTRSCEAQLVFLTPQQGRVRNVEGADTDRIVYQETWYFRPTCGV